MGAGRILHVGVSWLHPSSAWLALMLGVLLVPQHHHVVQAHSMLKSALESYKAHRVTEALSSSVTLTARPSLLEKSGDWVTVSWTGFSPSRTGGDDGGKKVDFVAAFSPIDAHPNSTAPVKFQYLSASSSSSSSSSGSLGFRLLNLRGGGYFFGLFQGTPQNATLVSRSDVVRFRQAEEVTQVHLALTGNKAGDMRVSWLAGDKSKAPVVRWRPQEGQEGEEKVAQGNTSTYTVDMMCGAPATTVGFVAPGSLHTAIMTGLQEGRTYTYTVGDSVLGVFSSPRVFRAPPLGGSGGPKGTSTTGQQGGGGVRVAVFGDMGTAEPDATYDSGHTEEVPSLNTTRLLLAALHDSEEGTGKRPLDLVLHIGDISYARGYASQWDEFGDQIEPVASAVPWMIGSGNHERDFPSTSPFRPQLSFYQGEDSGGECGVPLAFRYPMPPPSHDPKTDLELYSFEMGPIHVIVFCTEQDFRPGSVQYDFMERDLREGVDRTRTPFVVLTGHRPMYISSTNTWPEDGDQPVSQALRGALEGLLLAFKVDMAMWGHHHSYQRTCQVAGGSCQARSGDEDYGGVVHVVVGMAGQELTINAQPVKPEIFDVVDVKHYGLSLVTANHTHLTVTLYGDDDGQVLDEFTITSKHQRA